MYIIWISIYWFFSFLLLSFILNRFSVININFGYNQKLFKFLKKYNKYKNILPSVSKFNKKKIEHFNLNYLKLYLTEVNRALLMHTIIFLFSIPFIFINIIVFIVSNILLFIINLPFILILYYNQQNLIKKVRKYENISLKRNAGGN